MSLINTYLQEIRAMYPDNLDRDEWRFTRYGALTAAKEMMESPDSIVSEDLKQKAIASQGRLLKVPVMNIGDVTIKNVRSCTITDLENTSDLVTVNWVTLVADMSMMPAQYEKNEIGYMDDLRKKLTKIDHAFAKAVEDLIIAALEANKSQVFNSQLVGATQPYPVVGGALEVGTTLQDTFFNDADAIQEEDDFYSNPMKIIGSTSLKPSVMHYINQGGGNNENLNYQFDGKDFRFTNHIAVTAGKLATGYMMSDGSVGVISRTGPDFRAGRTAGDGTIWSEEFLPILGMTVGVMEKSNCADLSGAQAGLDHLKANKKEFWQFAVDIAVITPYNSDPANNAGTIKKFDFNA